MTWLSRLKKISIHPDPGATKPTKPMQDGCEGGFVGFVAPVLAHIPKTARSPATASTAPWDATGWRAYFDERAAVAEFDGALPRAQAEAQAFKCCVSEWLCRNPVTSEPGQCAHCGRGDLTYGPVLPYGDADHGHVWLHSECWGHWYAQRRQAAIAALTAIGLHEGGQRA